MTGPLLPRSTMGRSPGEWCAPAAARRAGPLAGSLRMSACRFVAARCPNPSPARAVELARGAAEVAVCLGHEDAEFVAGPAGATVAEALLHDARVVARAHAARLARVPPERVVLAGMVVAERAGDAECGEDSRPRARRSRPAAAPALGFLGRRPRDPQPGPRAPSAARSSVGASRLRIGTGNSLS